MIAQRYEIFYSLYMPRLKFKRHSLKSVKFYFHSKIKLVFSGGGDVYLCVFS